MEAVGDLAQEIAATRWYHVLELPDGTVTPGEFDLRSTAGRIPIPERLDGLRCLDVGTRDGFWAFELERRGAAEVVAIDVDDTSQHDWPEPRPVLNAEQVAFLREQSDSFSVAKRALGSSVERRNLSVYDLSPDEVGSFDLAVIGTLLVHLRDPVGALMAVRRVLKPGGTLIVNETISVSLSLLRRRKPTAALFTLPAPFWWLPNAQGLKRYVEAAGFECVELSRPYFVDRGPGMEKPRLRWRNHLGGPLRQLLLRAGLPHVHVVARPRAD